MFEIELDHWRTMQGIIIITPGVLLLLSFAFHDLKFCLSSQLKAASCAG